MSMSSDTFHIIPVEMLPNPGTCSVCGFNGRPCLDWGINIDYFGAVLICVECVRDLTNVPELELVHRSDVMTLMADNQRLIAREQEMQRVRLRVRSDLMDVANSIDHAVAIADSVDDNDGNNLFQIAETSAVNFLEIFGDASKAD